MDAEPALVERERSEMARLAPEMRWSDTREFGYRGGWEGQAPEWPFPRPRPPGLDALLQGERLALTVLYPQGFPSQAPRLIPRDPAPPPEEFFSERLHLNGDGSLCLVRHPSEWTAKGTAADLVVKASSWFIRYRATKVDLIEAMGPVGLAVDPDFDQLLERV